jgi:hypothetical protein
VATIHVPAFLRISCRGRLGEAFPCHALGTGHTVLRFTERRRGGCVVSTKPEHTGPSHSSLVCLAFLSCFGCVCLSVRLGCWHWQATPNEQQCVLYGSRMPRGPGLGGGAVEEADSITRVANSLLGWVHNETVKQSTNHSEEATGRNPCTRTTYTYMHTYVHCRFVLRACWGAWDLGPGTWSGLLLRPFAQASECFIQATSLQGTTATTAIGFCSIPRSGLRYPTFRTGLVQRSLVAWRPFRQSMGQINDFLSHTPQLAIPTGYRPFLRVSIASIVNTRRQNPDARLQTPDAQFQTAAAFPNP